MNTEAFCQAALKIANFKMFRDQSYTKLCSPRLGTGGSFEDIFLWKNNCIIKNLTKSIQISLNLTL